MRGAIMEVVETCKMMTYALAQQVIEGKATIEVIEENVKRVAERRNIKK